MRRPSAAASRAFIASMSALSTRVAQAVRDRVSDGSVGADEGDADAVTESAGSERGDAAQAAHTNATRRSTTPTRISRTRSLHPAPQSVPCRLAPAVEELRGPAPFAAVGLV